MPIEFVPEFQRLYQVNRLLHFAIGLKDIDPHSCHLSGIEVGILCENEDWKLLPWLEPIRCIDDHLGFSFLSETKKKRKSIVRLGVKECREKPKVL